MRISRVLVVALFVAVSGNASSSDNFGLCRDAFPECNLTLLTGEQVRVVEAFARGRNLRFCVDGDSKCELLKLTPKQISTLEKIREEQRAAHLAPILLSARNFSACAHGQEDCDPSKLTAQQLATLRRIVAEQRMVEASTPLQLSTPSADPSGRRRESMKRFGIGLLNVLGAVARAYLEIESEKPAARPIVVSGGGTVVVTPSDSGVVVGASSAFDSWIDGTFAGWTGETIFKLSNGQIWQQSSYDYHYHYAYRPKVFIYRSNLGYRMQVEGVTPTIAVVRLR